MKLLPQISAAKFHQSRDNSDCTTGTIMSLPTLDPTTCNVNRISKSLFSSDKRLIPVKNINEDSDGDDSISSDGSDDSSVSSVDSCLPKESFKSEKAPSRPLPINTKSASSNTQDFSRAISEAKDPLRTRFNSFPSPKGSPNVVMKKQIHDDLSHNCHHVLLSKPMAAVSHIHITVNAKDANVIASHARVPVQNRALPVVQRRGSLVHPGAILHQQLLYKASELSPSGHRLLSSGVPDELIDSVESLVNAQYYAGVPHFAHATVGSLLGKHSPHGCGYRRTETSVFF